MQLGQDMTILRLNMMAPIAKAKELAYSSVPEDSRWQEWDDCKTGLTLSWEEEPFELLGPTTMGKKKKPVWAGMGEAMGVIKTSSWGWKTIYRLPK